MFTKQLFIFLFLLLHAVSIFHAHAQVNSSDTIMLGAVEIAGSRAELFSASRQITRTDSASRALDIHNDAAEFITNQCALFVKSYGPGGSATVTSRGTEARHTAVLWNGFSINSPSLGLSDLSLTPLAHFGSLYFVNGGSSQVNGNASVGGALVLDNPDPSFNRANQAGFYTEVGSFGLLNLTGKYHYGGRFMDSKTTLFRQSSYNNFSYSNIAKKDHPEESQQHASVLNYGLLQDFAFSISPDQLISASLWYQVSDREIPPQMTSSVATSEQIDSLLRCFVAYRLTGKRTVLEVKAAWFDEKQNYDDTRQPAPYSYHTNTWNGEIAARYSPHRKLLLHAGVSGSEALADFREYTNKQERISVSPFAGFRWTIGEKLQLDMHVRKEFTNLEDGPVSPVAGINWRVLPGRIHFLANAGRHYAIPTMNDLYWVPGGNEALRPEDARSGDAGFDLFSDFRGLPQLTITSFYCQIKNWIRWQPSSGGIYKPDNHRELESYGIESSLKYSIKFRTGSCTLKGRYTYCRSSLSKADSYTESSLIGKQLTYTPVHMVSGQLAVTWRQAGITYRHQYTGDRFTTSDNTSFLAGYQIANVSVEYRFNDAKHNFMAYVKVNNLYNAEYQVMAYYPTPGRWISAGLQLDISFKQNNHKS